MLTPDQSRKLAAKVLAYSTFPECFVVVSSSEQAFTRFANNGITTAALVNRHSVSITATREGRTGVAEVNELEDRVLEAAVRRAEELAALSPPDPEHQPHLRPQPYPDLPAADEATATARAPQMIPQIGDVIGSAQKRKMIAAGLFERTTAHTAIANKAGLSGFHRSADARLSTTIRMPDGSSSGWAGQPSTRIAEISGESLAETAAGKCARWKGARRIEPGRYTVVLEPTATGDLVSLLSGGGSRGSGGAFSARAAEEGRSFLAKRGGGTRAGEKLFPEFISLRSDPFDPRLPSAPWSSDLLPAAKVAWIENGAVQNLAVDRYWAAKSGRKPTQSPSSLILEGGDATLAALIKRVERGLLVTHFWYIRFVNPQAQQYTGLTRDGLFLIEGGEIASPVMNLRFNDGPVHLLQKTLRLGRAARIRGLEGATMIAPALVAEDFNFTSTSEAI